MDHKIQKKLNDLLTRYKKNLPVKIAQITALWENLIEQWDLEQFQIFHREIHSLCGSSGTYGYLELSQKARALEVLLKKLLNADGLSELEKHTISIALKEMVIAANDHLNHGPLALSEAEHPTSNKIIYILEQNKSLANELKYNLKNIGYSPYVLEDFSTLTMALSEKSPIGIIINCHYLNNDNLEILKQTRHPDHPIQLFCLIADDSLPPRLLAIRAGCDAFFQLPLNIGYFTQVLHNKCSISTEPYRILIVDDSESLSEYYALILNQAGLNAHAINKPLELLIAMSSFMPHLLLMDIYMPDCTGIELAAVLRQEPNYTKIPIIFLSTEEDKNKQLLAMSLGGDDFLTKPISPQHLISAVRSRAKRASDLNYYMTTDSLTGLLNHSSSLSQLDIEFARARQEKTPLTVVMVDIDHFKKINDTYGHAVGDIVLKQIAHLFLVNLRSHQDIIGRYGGEEFILILPGTTPNNAKHICEGLQKQFSNHKFHANNASFSATFSGGISHLDQEETSQSLIVEADEALYQAKNNGRNCIVVMYTQRT